MTAAHKRIMIWFVLGAILATSLLLLFWPRAVAVDLAAVTPGSLVVTIDEEGETRVRDTFVLSAPVAGRMSRIDAEVGDAVIARKTIIAKFEPIDPVLLDVRSLAQARAGVRAAEATEKLVLANLSQAQAEFEFADAELARAHQLRKEKMISIHEVDIAIRNAKTTHAALDTTAAALTVSRHDLERVRAQLLSPTDERVDHDQQAIVTVLAPINGQILRLLRESEGIVAAGEPLVEIGDTDDLEIIVDLLSTDAVQVRPDQRVIINHWGGSGELKGKVRRVEPFAVTKVSALGIEEKRVNVIIDLISPAEQRLGLGHGFQLEVRIVLSEDDSTLTVPLTALFRDGDQWAVYVESRGRAVQRTVSLGRQTSLEAEITKGIESGEHIVLYPSDRVSNNTRIANRQSSQS